MQFLTPSGPAVALPVRSWRGLCLQENEQKLGAPHWLGVWKSLEFLEAVECSGGEGINILPQLGAQIAIHSTEGGSEFPMSDYLGCFVHILSGN